MKSILICFLLLINAVVVFCEDVSQFKISDKSEFYDVVIELEMEHAQKDGQLNNPNLTKDYLRRAEELLSWASYNEEIQEQNIAHYLVLTYYVNRVNEPEIISRAKYLLKQDVFRNDTNIVYTARALLDAYDRTEQFEEMLELYPLFYELNEMHGNLYHREDFDMHSDVGMAYYRLNNLSNAVVEFKKAAIGLEEVKDYFKLSSMQNNIALGYGKLRQLDSAIMYYDYALSNLDKVTPNNPLWPWEYVVHFKNVVASNKAMILFRQVPNYDPLPFLFESLRTSVTSREPHITRSAYYSIAEVYLRKGKYEHVLNYIDSTMDFLRNHPHNETLLKTIQLQGRCFAELGDKQNSNLAYDRYELISDSFAQAKALKLYISATVDFDTKVKEAELVKTQREFERSSEKNKYLGLGLLGLIVVVFVLIFLSIDVIKSRQMAISQKQQLREALEDKNVLLKEIHHRVKNNLQIISGLLDLQADKIDNPDITQSFNESQLQIQSISLVHQMLYEMGDPASIKMQTYLEKLCNNTIPISSKDGIHCTIDCGSTELSLEKATPIGLITSELLINSIKHAFQESEGNIWIRLNSTEGNGYVFEYADDGIGLPSGFDIDKTETLGLSLVKMLVEELNGTLELNGDKRMTLKIAFIAV